MGYIINAEKFNSLSPKTQQLLIEGFNLAADVNIKEDEVVIAVAKKIAMESPEHTYIQLTTAEELKPWLDAMDPVNGKWIKETEAKGYPAQKVYDHLMKLLEQNR